MSWAGSPRGDTGLYASDGKTVIGRFAAVGSDGNGGYVLRSDLDTVGKGEVPVYASDGVTVVDAINP